MKIALLGYGKMGLAIKEIAEKRGHTISQIFNSKNAEDIEAELAADVAIEFSRPESVVNNIKNCVQKQIPIVVGTTAWNKYQKEVEELVLREKGTMLAASNFSVGVNLFFVLNSKFAELMRNNKEYNPSITEIHHTEKLDAPSGTAISLAEQQIKKSGELKRWALKGDNNNLAGTLQIEAIREKGVPGTHTITFDSEIDSLEIKHTAKNRQGFALGAVLAAEFIKDKKGIFSMQDILKI